MHPCGRETVPSGDRDSAPAPLAGIRVIEIANYISGPFASSLLAGLGAEVIKVEQPAHGDPFRSWGGGDYSPTFQSVNRGKQSLVLDLRTPEGVAIASRLLATSDVLVENLRPGALRRLGIDIGMVKAANPGFIECSISGFGLTGPYAGRPGYDTIGQAVGGLLGLLTDFDEPQPMGVSISDHLTALNAALGVVASLAGRAADPAGRGRQVSTSLFQATVSFVGENAARYLADGAVPTRQARVALAQAYAFTAGDGQPFVVHLSSQERFWLGLTVAIDRPDLRDDPRFGRLAQRIVHYDDLHAVLASCFLTADRVHWLDRLAAADVPAGPIQRFDELFMDPGLTELEVVDTVRHPAAGEMQLIGPGFTLQGLDRSCVLAPPLLGEHTDGILGRLGFDENEIARLRTSGVVA
jgi:crotonobetainyl-CoA:carnitine CoA-transferase CaiB-like acyl-CoA transferase